MKKRFLFIAVAAAVAIGCTNELLDTSYDNVKTGKQKGLVFNAYVGNGMQTTRSVYSNSSSNTFIFDANNADGSHWEGHYGSSDWRVASKGFGILGYTYYSSTNDAFADYYGINVYNSSSETFKTYYGTTSPISGNSMYDYTGYSSSSNQYTTDGRFWYKSSYTPTESITPNFLYNPMLAYTNVYSSSNIYTLWDYNMEDDEYNSSRIVYLPTRKVSETRDLYGSFFAYYPHVNTNSPEYNSDKNPLHIISREQSGAPYLDFEVPTYNNNLVVYDLMAATPVIDQLLEDGTNIDLHFKHLLAAVYVNVKYTPSSYSSSSTEPTFNFYKLSLQGAYDENYDPYSSSYTPKVEVSEKSMFRKHGKFNLATGQWFTKGYEVLDLLGSCWLTKAKDFQFNSSYDYYSLFGNDPSEDYGTNWYPQSTSDIYGTSNEFDHFMLIIPNSYQNTLRFEYDYTMTQGAYTETVSDYKDIPLPIEPGKMYYLTMNISKEAITFSYAVDDWEVYSSSSIPMP